MNVTRLPQVDKILRDEQLVALEQTFRRDLLTQLVREELALIRESPNAQENCQSDSVAARVAAKARELLKPALKKVINATGVVLNTNLGRAPLSAEALSDLAKVAEGYCNLEIDLLSGKRGKRSLNIERLLTLLTDAESAIVVNNNAAAVLLCVSTFARNKGVIVSRGELIEIGGSFRLPDVIQAGGARLKEVGTTNRTRLEDYKQAVDGRSGMFLRCHRSNFEIRGFTHDVQLPELAALAAQTGLPLLEDLGSGALQPMTMIGHSEPTVKEVVLQGADLVSFSGDKLLGGPQAGFVVGKRELIAKLSKHPLYRAMRLDKLMLYLVERCLIAYLSPNPQDHIPILSMLSRSASDLQARARSAAATISDAQNLLTCLVVPTVATAGGGSLPGETLPSFGIQLSSKQVKAAKLQAALRMLDLPIIATIENDHVMLDFRTVNDSEDKLLIEGLLQVCKQLA